MELSSFSSRTPISRFSVRPTHEQNIRLDEMVRR